jgi:hypothetical protein
MKKFDFWISEDEIWCKVVGITMFGINFQLCFRFNTWKRKI